MINDLTQFTLYVLILTVLIVPMGMWLARTFSSPSHSTPERLTYKVLGIDPEEKMSWSCPLPDDMTQLLERLRDDD